MVAEPWIVKMGNQVSTNLKQALLLETSTRKKTKPKRPENKEIIGILSFEVANIISKTVHLHKSLTEPEISKLKREILSTEGVRSLVSSDESYLLELALAEKLEELNRVAGAVSRLGKKCSEPALQGFEHVYGDIVSGVIDVKELGFLVKNMEGMVRKMDRYVSATRNLYSEMEVLNELEQAVKKFQHNQHEESKRAFEQKLMWQKQDVRHLKDISLWSQTYDKVVELLARTVCTIYVRITVIFCDSSLRADNLGFILGGSPSDSSPMKKEPGSVSSQTNRHQYIQMGSERLQHSISDGYGCSSGSSHGTSAERRGGTWKSRVDTQRDESALIRPEEFGFPCGTGPGRLFMECLSLSSSGSKLDDVLDCEEQHNQISTCFSMGNGGVKGEHPCNSGILNHARIGILFSGEQRQGKPGVAYKSSFGPKSRLAVYATPSTVGGSALALHYANVIIVIEKLLRYPHLVGEEARDDLYQMLPTSLRISLRAKLKSYVKNLAIYDAPLAHDWKEKLDGILRWLAPLAHNMIRWQSERNFEQHQIVTRTNVLRLQTLYFADREKTEEAICELLVGLNYICRYEQQQNALLDCASSFDFEDCMQWQLECQASHLN